MGQASNLQEAFVLDRETLTANLTAAPAGSRFR